MEGPCNIGGARCVKLAEPPRQAGEELGKDDAAVPACAQQGAPGHGGGDAAHGGAIPGLHVLPDASHREPHIGAGVAVWDGEDVQGIEDLIVLLKGHMKGVGHAPEVCARQRGARFPRFVVACAVRRHLLPLVLAAIVFRLAPAGQGRPLLGNHL